MPLARIIELNAVQLQDGVDVLKNLTGEHYTRVLTPMMSSSVGQHLRHVIEHYDCLRDGMASGCIDYTQRVRDVRTETDRDFAVQHLCEQIDWLQKLVLSSDVALVVCHEPAVAASAGNASSAGREFEFLLSHTAHHFALIAAMLRAYKLDVPQNFGLAVSTQLHRIANTAGKKLSGGH